jgi:hypothetical protein
MDALLSQVQDTFEGQIVTNYCPTARGLFTANRCHPIGLRRPKIIRAYMHRPALYICSKQNLRNFDLVLTNLGSSIDYGFRAARHLPDVMGWSRGNVTDNACCCSAMARL